MLSTLISLVIAWPVLAQTPAPLTPGTLLAFRGGLVELQADRAGAEPSKTFDVTFLVAESGPSATRLFWLVDQRGEGNWPWVERFGQLTLDAQGQPTGAAGPSLLYDYGEGSSVVPLPSPLLLATTPLAAGATWEQGGLKHEVEGPKQIDDRATWQVQVHNNFGLKRTVWVGQDSPWLVGLEERVFMNQGTEYRLKWRLIGAETLPEGEFQATSASFAALVALKTRLNRPEQSEDEAFTPEQRQTLTEGLPEVEKLAAGPLVKLIKAARSDLQLQTGRADSIAELSAQYQGQPVADFDLTGLGRDKLSSDDLANQVTVLHFWDYRPEPLVEPYGQVGYLEFLYSRHKAAGLKVYGVAVDSRLKEDGSRGGVVAGVRRLKAFMNLTYPIVLDDGEVLKQLGDPRLLGATLPLYVVVGPDGKIAHYHVGLYDVDRQEGLKKLDALISGLLKK